MCPTESKFLVECSSLLQHGLTCSSMCPLKGFLKSQGAGHRVEQPNFVLHFVKLQA